MNTITSYARIKDGIIRVNGELIYEGPANTGLPALLSDAYKQLKMSYPKFHKMDLLSKLGLLCTEAALAGKSLHEQSTAIVLSNSAASLDTDRHHQASISDPENFFPSPAVFVYTLPNIVIGEMAIRYKLTGENAFFVTKAFDAGLLRSYAEMLLASEHTDAVLCGWINVDGADYDGLIYLVEKPADSNKNSIFKPHSSETVNHIYF